MSVSLNTYFYHFMFLICLYFNVVCCTYFTTIYFNKLHLYIVISLKFNIQMVLSKMIDEVPGAGAVRTSPAQETIAAGSTYSLLRVGTLENYTASGKFVDVWRVAVW